MNIKIDTNNLDAFDVLVNYCKKNGISYDSLIMTQSCTVVVKNPSDETLSAIYKFVDKLSNMVKIKADIITNKVEIPLNKQ